MRTKQQEIITALGVQPEINPALEIKRRSQFLADYLGCTGLKGFVLGISGGQDSLLAGMLAQRAVELRRHNGHQAEFHAVLLPYGKQRDRADAELAITTINPDAVHDINIKPSVDALVASINSGADQPLSDFNRGNIKARMRMVVQYALAGTHGLLVIGADHAAEAITGFYTKYGDGAADVVPLAGLTKRQGRDILKALGVPEPFLNKQPTADLLDERPAQSDEAELGLSYDAIDCYLEGKEVDPAIALAIEQRYDLTQHKRTMPVAYIPSEE